MLVPESQSLRKSWCCSYLVPHLIPSVFSHLCASSVSTYVCFSIVL